jgi:colicin import membrane protein
MSATVYYEPYRLPAGVLALVVHGVFFALLYFGFNWNRQVLSNPTMSVELWPSLPEEAVAPSVIPKVEVVAPPPTPQEKIVEPDIVMPDKKKVEAKPVETKPDKREAVRRAAEEARKKAEAQKAAEQRLEAQHIADAQAAQQNAELAKQAEQAAALGKLIDEYKARIQRRIRSNIVQPPNVSEDARAEFLVTLLPGGDVLTAKLIKSSGNKAYDDRVERAILKSSPLPLPQDVQLFNRFRELDLTFKPDKPTE